jgi:hypothetical protein
MRRRCVFAIVQACGGWGEGLVAVGIGSADMASDGFYITTSMRHPNGDIERVRTRLQRQTGFHPVWDTILRTAGFTKKAYIVQPLIPT